MLRNNLKRPTTVGIRQSYHNESRCEAYVKIHGRRKSVGTYSSVEDAQQAIDKYKGTRLDLFPELCHIGRHVLTPYGEGPIKEINEAYGVKVQYDSGETEWHPFSYIQLPKGDA